MENVSYESSDQKVRNNNDIGEYRSFAEEIASPNSNQEIIIENYEINQMPP